VDGVHQKQKLNISKTIKNNKINKTKTKNISKTKKNNFVPFVSLIIFSLIP